MSTSAVNSIEVDQVRLAHLLQTLIEIRDAIDDPRKRKSVCDDLVQAFSLTDAQKAQLEGYSVARQQHNLTLQEIAKQQAELQQAITNADNAKKDADKRIAEAEKAEKKLEAKVAQAAYDADEAQRLHDERESRLNAKDTSIAARETKVATRETAATEREAEVQHRENEALRRENAIDEREATFLQATKMVTMK